MRTVFLILIMIIISGCAIKPKYAVQTATGLEVGLSKDTNKTFKLIDKNNRIVAQADAKEKKLIFSLPIHTLPNICYTIINDEGEYLYDPNTGFKITSIYDYNQKITQLNDSQREHAKCVQNENNYTTNIRIARANLDNNKLFNGQTCNLPPQRDIPSFPETICGNYLQCQELANDLCIKNLIDAESCGLALLKTEIHSSITSVSCGVLLASLNGEKYGIGMGVQDAITGYLDERTKNLIKTGEYGEALATGLIRIGITYFRTESCKENFAKAAYAPIENWLQTKDYIEKEPYIEQNKCNMLIQEYNLFFEKLNDSTLCLQDLGKKIVFLSESVQKAKVATSAPEACSFK